MFTTMLKEELNNHGVGDTIFTRSRNIEKLLNFSKIYLKFEGGNPTGTMKDRAAVACLTVARERGYDALVIASCGNFGASFVHFARGFGIEPHVYIPAQYHTPRIGEMEREGGIIHRVRGTYEEAVEVSAAEAQKKGWYDGNPGTEENTRASLEAYAEIAYEIYERLRRVPDVVAVPTGNGTTLSGVYHGFKKLRDEGKAEGVPRMIAASTTGGNSIVSSFQKGLRRVDELDPESIVETEHNEPLVNWRSLDGQKALDTLWESGGWATHVSDGEMVGFSDTLAKEEGLLVLPASAASLAALDKYVKEKPGEERSYVALLTARKF